MPTLISYRLSTLAYIRIYMNILTWYPHMNMIPNQRWRLQLAALFHRETIKSQCFALHNIKQIDPIIDNLRFTLQVGYMHGHFSKISTTQCRGHAGIRGISHFGAAWQLCHYATSSIFFLNLHIYIYTFKFSNFINKSKNNYTINIKITRCYLLN